jgi:hypothetical protein
MAPISPKALIAHYQLVCEVKWMLSSMGQNLEIFFYDWSSFLLHF